MTSPVTRLQQEAERRAGWSHGGTALADRVVWLVGDSYDDPGPCELIDANVFWVAAQSVYVVLLRHWQSPGGWERARQTTLDCERRTDLAEAFDLAEKLLADHTSQITQGVADDS